MNISPEYALSICRGAFAVHYKAERQRAEDCLNDILTILCDGGTDTEQVDKITDRITHHYARTDPNQQSTKELSNGRR